MGLTDYVPGAAPIGRTLGLIDSNADSLNKDAQSAVAQSNANAQGAYDLALQEAIAAGAYTGPGQVTTQQVYAPTIQAGLADRTGTVAAATPQAQVISAGPAQGYTAALADAASARGDIVGYDPTMQKVERAPVLANSANIADVNTMVKAPTMDEAAQTAGIEIGGTEVGRASVAPIGYETRDESLAAARAIANSPSAAASQFKAGMDQVTDDALSVASQARGNDRAGARREAIIQMGQKGAQAAEAAAAIAAQEQTAKLTGYSQALQGVRGADVSVAEAQGQIDSARVQAQASIEAQRQNTQAQLNAAIAQGNTAAINALNLQKAQLDLEAQKASVQAGLTQQSTVAQLVAQNAREQNARDVTNAQIQNAANAANATASNSAAAQLTEAKNLAAREAAGAATNVSLSNAAAKTGAAANLAGAVNTQNQQMTALATGTSATNAAAAAAREEANAGRATTLAASDAGNKTSANQATGSAQLAASTQNAANALTASQTNATNQLQTQQLNQAGKTSAISGMNQAAGVQSGNAGTVTGANKAAAETQQKSDAALLGAGGTATTAFMASDKRAKQDIKKPSSAAVDDLAEKLSAYTWRYKPGYEDGGQDEHGGVMAQAVEKSPLGRKFVHEDAEGTKRVDVLSLAAMMAAAAARSVKKSKERRT